VAQGASWFRWLTLQRGLRIPSLGAFYMRVKARRGEKTAVVALVRKILTIIYHILVNREPYVEENFKKRLRLRTPTHPSGLSLEDMAEVLRNAGYLVSPLSD
jgi:hypothetical protein